MPASQIFQLAALLALLAFGHEALATPNPPTETKTRRATAFDVEDGSELYTEAHFEVWRSGIHESSIVEYRSPGGELLAKKTLRYDHRRLLPTMRFEDVRSGAEELTRWAGKRYVVGCRESRNDELETSTLRLPKLSAADAGFDKAVRKHWNQLARGEALTFGFAVPAKLDYFNLTLEKTDVVERDGRKLLQLEMSPSNLFLNLVVEPVVLLYDTETQTLVEYLGRSNIRTSDGSVQDARIVFAPCEVAAKPAKNSSGPDTARGDRP
jgi:hypothetical protein